MPVVTSAAPAIVNLAQAIETKLNESPGTAARVTMGNRATAFDWTDGLPPWVGTVFNGALVDGLMYRTVIVKPSNTPVIEVERLAAKPDAVTLTGVTATLPKYAGYAAVATEDILDTAGLLAAIQSVLIDQALTAFSADVAAQLSDAMLSASGANWAAAILSGIGVLPTADVLVVAPADLAAMVDPSSGYQLSMREAIPTVFGLGLVMLPGLESGTAYVAKSSALTLFESALSPAVLVDPYSRSTDNVVLIVCDLWARAQLTAPGAVCEITVA